MKDRPRIDGQGQGLVEYALIIFLVAAIVVLGTLGGQVVAVFQSVTGSL